MSATLDILVKENREKLEELQTSIGYQFKDLALLQLALVHSSYAFEQMKQERHYETQEFLGDSVLDLTLGYILFMKYPDMREGNLTKIRASLVNESGLADMARAISLGDYLLLGHGEEASNGREKPSILSCAYEALVGGIFLDGGYDAALSFVQKWFEPLIQKSRKTLDMADTKSALQERLQEKYNAGPEYVIESEDGPPHARMYTVSVHFEGRLLGRGIATSKKLAEQKAAREALEQFNNIAD